MQFEYSVGECGAWSTERVSRFDFREVLGVDACGLSMVLGDEERISRFDFREVLGVSYPLGLAWLEEVIGRRLLAPNRECFEWTREQRGNW